MLKTIKMHLVNCADALFSTSFEIIKVFNLVCKLIVATHKSENSQLVAFFIMQKFSFFPFCIPFVLITFEMQMLWYQNSFLLDPTDRRSMHSKDDRYILTIKNFQPSDFGNYR